jgi:hypothetical protein
VWNSNRDKRVLNYLLKFIIMNINCICLKIIKLF